MGKPLEAAAAGQTLRDVLVRLGPGEFAGALKTGNGFRIGIGGAGPEWIGEGAGRGRIKGSDIVAEVAIEVAAEYGVALQTVTLTNEGAEPSPAIDELEVLHLPLTIRLKDCPRARGIGGGKTDGFYPPAAYREELVSFGAGRSWDPTDTKFSRWWTTKRWYTLHSGPEGRSSSVHLPVIQVAWKAGDGEVGLWAALEWSGRWQLQMGTDEHWEFVLRGGPTVKGMVLEPGETLKLPRVHVGVYGGPGVTLEDGGNCIRRYLAEVHAPDVQGRRPWPYVAYCHWSGIDATLTEELLIKQADRAAELGLESFEVDAAWYATDGEKFYEGLGNWERVDQKKFPRGLEPFAEYVRSKGMDFGLWFEPERARVGSDWLAQHPDWYWPSDAPQYSILNLTLREAQDGLIEMLSRWIERLDIRWLKWDHNQSLGPVWDSVDPTGKVQFAYFEGLYRVFDTLLARYPNLAIDNCSGGGNRSDFGTLRRAGTMVQSDHGEDPHIVRIMQTGGARVLPGNYMFASMFVGHNEGDQTIGPLDLISRMAGSIRFGGHIADWSKPHARKVRKYVDGFKTFRHLLMKDFHALRPYPRSVADWDIVEFVDPATTEAVVLAYRVRGGPKAQTVLLKGLDPDAGYSIVDPFSARRPAAKTGRELMEKGLRLTLAEESALVRHVKLGG